MATWTHRVFDVGSSNKSVDSTQLPAEVRVLLLSGRK